MADRSQSHLTTCRRSRSKTGSIYQTAVCPNLRPNNWLELLE